MAHLLSQGLRVDESHKVDRKVAHHAPGFAGLPDFKAQLMKELGFNGSLRKGSPRRPQGTVGVKLVSAGNHGELPGGFNQHVHGEAGDAIGRREGFYDSTWSEKREHHHQANSLHTLQIDPLQKEQKVYF